MPPRARKPTEISWNSAAPDRVVVVRGGEDLLAERAVAAIIVASRAVQPETEVIERSAVGYSAGDLALALTPSLFLEPRVVVIDDAEQASEAFLADVARYVAAPDDDVVLVLRHHGGVRGRKLVDLVTGAGYPLVTCEPLKRDADKVAFLRAEFESRGRKVEAESARALVDALGTDLRELAAAASQLMADHAGTIRMAAVATLVGGRVEATGFQVADAAATGQVGQALLLTRHAFDTGVDPVLIVAALASRLRTLAKVAGARRRGLDVADLGIAPWQADKARRELSRWDGGRMARAIDAVAAADEEVKGASRDPRFAVERAVATVARLAGGR